MKLNIIVAADDNMGIGVKGKLPWCLKQDMTHFKNITTTTQHPMKRNVVIMGNNTWLSIPERSRPLRDRINIVLSTQLLENPKGAYQVSSFEKAMELLGGLAVENVFVIGGASVYKDAMQRTNKIYLTRIFASFVCDTFFPNIDDTIFYKVSPPSEIFEENGIKYIFEVYEKYCKTRSITACRMGELTLGV